MHFPDNTTCRNSVTVHLNRVWINLKQKKNKFGRTYFTSKARGPYEIVESDTMARLLES